MLFRSPLLASPGTPALRNRSHQSPLSQKTQQVRTSNRFSEKLSLWSYTALRLPSSLISFAPDQITTTILPIEHRGETFYAFPRRSPLHIPIDRSTPLLNRGAMSFLLPYHNHAPFVVIELLSGEYIQISRGMSDAAGCPLVAQMSVDRCLPQTPSWMTFPVRMPFMIPAGLQFRSSRFKTC